MQDWVDTFVRLRGELAVAKQLGDLGAAKDGLTRVLGLLELITRPAPTAEGDRRLGPAARYLGGEVSTRLDGVARR